MSVVLAGGLVLVVGAAVAVVVVLGGIGETPTAVEATLEEALQALDDGAYQEARQMAKALRQSRPSPGEALGAPSFVLGAAAAYEADDAWQADREGLYLVAARYLEEARDLGFPPGREGEGLYLLGRCLYLTGRMAESRLVLYQALENNPWRKTEIHRLLAAAYLEDAQPKLLEALEQNAIYLADPTLSDAARHEGLLQRAEILLRLGKTAQCSAALKEIPQTADNYPEAIVVQARVLMHEAEAFRAAPGAGEEGRLGAAEKYGQAIQTLRQAQGRDTLELQAGRKAMYLIGLCYEKLGDDRAAISQFQRTRNKHVGTPEAQASDFRIAEIARRLGHDDEAFSAYGRLLAAIGDAKQYRNPWLPLDDLRAGLLRAYEQYRDAEKFEACLRLAELVEPVFTPARALELAAEAHQHWGRSLLAQAGHLPLSKAEPLRRQGRTQLRLAGRAFEKLAELRANSNRSCDDLWRSAECYLEGKGYREAAESLQAYLKAPAPNRHPAALASLGEALLAEGRLDEALGALEQCMGSYPRDPASFRARLAASHARQEKGELEKAQALLEENLGGGALTPDSTEWRDSLFSLGKLFHAAGRYQQAALRLEEAVARYPQAPQATEARYLIADSHQRRARQLEAEQAQDLVPSAQSALAVQRSQLLLSALGQYRQAREALAEREKATELSLPEKSLLRNCSFAIAATLFELGRYEEAIDAYSLVASIYANAPEVLEAYTQIARAYRQLHKPEEARRAVQQARVALDRIAPSVDSSRTTIFSSDEWRRVLDGLASS